MEFEVFVTGTDTFVRVCGRSYLVASVDWTAPHDPEEMEIPPEAEALPASICNDLDLSYFQKGD